MLKGKLLTTTDSLTHSEADAKANRETITRIVADLNKLEKDAIEARKYYKESIRQFKYNITMRSDEETDIFVISEIAHLICRPTDDRELELEAIRILFDYLYYYIENQGHIIWHDNGITLDTIRTSMRKIESLLSLQLDEYQKDDIE
jgi:hypothetical protein